jgi:hypothetical protein
MATPVGLGVRTRCTRYFFDRDVVKRYIGAKNAAAMGRIGAYIRTRARTSMRYRKRASLPGQPPSAHTGLLRGKSGQGGIDFSFDPSTYSLVVGPIKLNKVYFNRAGEPITGPVPNVLEFGGDIHVLEVWKGVRRDVRGKFATWNNAVTRTGTWVRADLRRKSKLSHRRKRLRRVHIQARPYMRPALMKELPNIPKAWSASVRAA